MNRGIALVAVAVVLVAVAGIAAAGPVGTAVAQDDPAATNETDGGGETGTANETDISPGERLSGVMGVQRAEIAGEVESRAFEVGLNRTESDEERATLVAERLNRTEQRLTAIERRQRELRELRDAGELTRGEFAARMAETGARAETVKREANRSAAVARDLPEPVRRAQGLDADRLDAVRERANGVGGPEVAAIARGVAGEGVGRPLASERRGPPADAPGARSGTGNASGPETGNGTGPGAGGPPGGDGRPGNGGPSAGDRAPRNGGGPSGNATGPAGAGNGSDAGGNATPRSAAVEGSTSGNETGPNDGMTDDNETNAGSGDNGTNAAPGDNGTNAAPGDNGTNAGSGGDGSDGAPADSEAGARSAAGDRRAGIGSAAATAVAEVETLAGRLTGSWAHGTDTLRRIALGVDG
ncbi:hypothetical protein [Halorubrum lipolyticum]|uniref:Uncharacterized protein n=1 Tax=Halorubrum lipolyticum DSM 21995 TaxID=1227482 RepID=M0NYX0_9EURY|nr:hypothetical protein [Halorubrum lipolyticum]EMA63117.1 hypothetical protein C469_03815 [Halorubrum lipolyticum DSM 21995]